MKHIDTSCKWDDGELTQFAKLTGSGGGESRTGVRQRRMNQPMASTEIDW